MYYNRIYASSTHHDGLSPAHHGASAYYVAHTTHAHNAAMVPVMQAKISNALAMTAGASVKAWNHFCCNKLLTMVKS